MGMHFGLIVTPTSPQELIDSWNEIWTDQEIVESHSGFKSSDEFWQWMDTKEKFVASVDWTKDNPGTDTYAIWKDGEWSVLFDKSYVFASDENVLSELSKRFGKALSFVVETAGGTAFFGYYQKGELIRKIEYFDGQSILSGTPLEEENGVDVNNYYMEETEALLSAFHLSPVETFPLLESTISLAVTDRKDYGAMLKELKNKELKKECNPWWKFW